MQSPATMQARCPAKPILRPPRNAGRLPMSVVRVLAVPEQQRHTSASADRPEEMYEHALELSRQERYNAAREAFEGLLQQHPHFCKAWVSYAQMEKRMGRLSDPLRAAVARHILQRGLTSNPESGCLLQAWGLMELQKGNMWAAVRLLERSVDMDPFLQPVLRWKPVSVARMAIAGSSARRGGGPRLRGVACASSGTGAAAAAAGAAGGACGAGGGSAVTSGGAGGAAPGGGAGGASSGSTGGCMSSM